MPTWSKVPPDREGWYWARWRAPGGGYLPPSPDEVRPFDGHLCLAGGKRVGLQPCEWAGPIEEPREPDNDAPPAPAACPGCEDLKRGRDWSERHIRSLEARLDAAEAERDHLRACLELVEWSPLVHDRAGDPSCPSCGGVQPDIPRASLYAPEWIGHRPDCRLARLLAPPADAGATGEGER